MILRLSRGFHRPSPAEEDLTLCFPLPIGIEREKDFFGVGLPRATARGLAFAAGLQLCRLYGTEEGAEANALEICNAQPSPGPPTRPKVARWIAYRGVGIERPRSR